MLETVRRFALDRLEEWDGDETRGRLTEWLIDLAESYEQQLISGGDTVPLLERIEVEQENVRSALAWALDAGQAERALRLATALRFFWETRGYFAEAGRWLNEALAQGADVDPAVRAKALTTAGTIAFRTGDVETARERYEQGLVIWRELGDEQGIARCLSDIGTVAAAVGDLDRAEEMLEESAERFRELDQPHRLAVVISNLGHVAGQRQDYDRAIELSQEALDIERKLGRRPNAAISHDEHRDAVFAGRPRRRPGTSEGSDRARVRAGLQGSDGVRGRRGRARPRRRGQRCREPPCSPESSTGSCGDGHTAPGRRAGAVR